VRGVFIHPAMGDDGTSAGGPLFVLSCGKGGLEPRPLEHVYLGNELGAREIEEQVLASGLSFERVADIDGRVGELLADGNVVARVTGRSEYGPRALGHRSNLCSA